MATTSNERITSLDQCNSHHILTILQTLDILNDSRFIINDKSYKNKVISYFEKNKIDGNKILQTNTKQFRQSIIKYCDGQQKLNGILGKLYLYFTKRLDINDFDNLTQNNDTEPHKKIKKKKTKNIQQCNNMELIYVVNYIFDNDKAKHIEKLKENKEIIISYLSQNNMNGQELYQMHRKQFVTNLAGSNTKLRGPLGVLYKIIHNDSIQEYIIPITSKQEEKSLELQHITCTQLIYALQHFIFNDVKDKDKTGKLQQYKDKIIQYFKINNLDGQYLKNAKRREIPKKISEWIGDKKLNSPLMKIHAAIINFEWNERLPSTIINQQNDDEIEEKQDNVESFDTEHMNHKTIIYALENYIFDELIDQKGGDLLKEYKVNIIQCIKNNNWNGKDIKNMKRKDFRNEIATHCKNKKLNSPLLKVLNGILQFDWSQVSNSIVRIKEERIREEKDNELLLPDTINKCNTKQLLFILNNYIFNDDHIDKHIAKLLPFKDKINEFFIENKINGERLCLSTMNRKDFAKQLYESLGGDKKKNGACLKLHGKLIKYNLNGNGLMEKPKENVLPLPTQIKDYNVKQLIYCIKDIFDKNKDDKHIEKLLPYKDNIIKYFIQNEIDGNKLCLSGMNRKDFSKELYLSLDGDKKKNGACLKLHTKIIKYKSDSFV